MKSFEGILSMKRLAGLVGAGATCAALALAAGAQATVSAPPIPGSFAYHETDTPDGRCGWGWGLQFAPIKGVTDYSYTYYDGYWKSDFGSDETSAEFLAETYSTPSLYFHGITGGTGPQPCTDTTSDDDGRFPDPPTITPVYPDGKNPPLAASKSSSKPASAGRATLQAAKGTFPVGSTPYVDIVLKSNHALSGFKVSHVHASNGARVVVQPEIESLIIPAHSPQTFTAEIEGKRAGRSTLSVTFSGTYLQGKKAKKVTITASSSLLFAKA